MPERRDDKALWDRQWELFHAALERPADERHDFLIEACSEVDLRHAVEELLAIDESGSGPLDASLDIESIEVHDGPTEPLPLRRSTDPLPRGRVLAGRFEIESLVGEGGMGAVYAAHDRDLGGALALKMLHPELSASETSRQRFRREIQLARQVTHPNVCRIFDLFQDGELSFLTMELLEGETLQDRIRARGPLVPGDALPLVEQICAGLAAAHAAGVVHRDLKSANIMLLDADDSSRAVITDFGLARTRGTDSGVEEAVTLTGELLGTPAYMAPEQLEGGALSAATDIYALGVILFELVTGRLPFEGRTPYSIVGRRLREQAPSPSEYRLDLEPVWERVIRSCLERDPLERPRDPEEVAARLRGEVRPRRWTPRRRRRWGMALALVALLAALGGSLGSRWLAPERPAGSSGQLLAEPDWLLIADFDNRTGEPIVDGILETALRRELANSKLVNVASEARVRDTLQLMGRSVDIGLDADLAREVALRDGGIDAVVAGQVERFGSTYLLNVDLLGPADGAVLASLSEEAAGQESILAATRRLSRRMRERLGEVMRNLDTSDGSLSRVSTSSLSALQLYSRADRLLAEENLGGPDRNRTAEELLREAIAEDPEFAAAHTHLAWALERQKRPADDYLPHAARAVELADRATVVERYFIQGSYYNLRSQLSGRKSDAEAALAQYQALLELDPLHPWVVPNTENLLIDLGRGQEILGMALRRAEARPNNAATLANAAREIILIEGDLDAARPLVERALQLESELPGTAGGSLPFLTFYPAHELWLVGDVEGVLQEVDRIVGSLNHRDAADRAGHARTAADYYLDLGRFEDADALQARYGFTSPRQWQWKMALRRGDREVVRELTHWRAQFSPARFLPELAMDMAKLGYAAEAQEFLDALPEEFELLPGDVLAARGIIDFHRGDYQQAISQLTEALPLLLYRWRLDYYLAAVRTLSKAWEALGETERGLPVLEEASGVKPRLLWGRPIWMELELRRAEVYRQLGRTEEAHRIEAELRRYCALADPDFPMRRELARRGWRQPRPVG